LALNLLCLLKDDFMSDPINNNLPISPASELARQVTRDTRESERHGEARSEQKQAEQQVAEQVDQFIHQERPRLPTTKETPRRPADNSENIHRETVSQAKEAQRVQHSAGQVVRTPPTGQTPASLISSPQKVPVQPEVSAGQSTSNQSQQGQEGQGHEPQTTATALAQDFARLTRGIPQLRSQTTVTTTPLAPRPVPTALTTAMAPKRPLSQPQRTPTTPSARTASSTGNGRSSPGGRVSQGGALTGQPTQTTAPQATPSEVVTNPESASPETSQGREAGVYDFALAERGHYTHVSPEQVRDNLTAAIRFQQIQRGTPVPVPFPVATQQQLGETLSARLRNTRSNSERTAEGENKEDSGRVSNRDLALGMRRQFRDTAC